MLNRSFLDQNTRKSEMKSIHDICYTCDTNHTLKIVSEYDQEIPQSQTADKPLAPRGRPAQPSRDTRKTNQAKQPALSSPTR